MAEVLTFSDYALGTVVLVGTSAEALVFGGSSAGVVSTCGASVEALTFGDSARGSVIIQGTAAERLRCGERSSGPIWGRSGESWPFSESARGFSLISGTGRESIGFGEQCSGLVVEIDVLSDDTTAWCVNLATGGHSRYTGPLDGSQTAITGRVVTAVSQLGSDRTKYVPDLYVTGRLDADLTVTTITDEQTRRDYPLPADNRQGLHRRRLKLARGIKGTSWQFTVSGTGFTLRSIEVPPIASQRVA